MSTNLIDAYVSEVGRRLPRRTRTDIEAELRSTLQDMLDERAQSTGKPIDEEMILDVLKAYGAPEKVAATYQGERYLIGPSLYPIFMLVLRIVLIVTGVLAAIGLGIALSPYVGNPQNAIQAVLKAVANFIVTIMTALGNIVLIFSILEWALYRAGGKLGVKGSQAEKDWDPRSLTKVSATNQVKMGNTIAEIVGSFAAIVIFNFYPQVFSYTASLNGVVGSGWAIGFGSATFSPIFSEAFFRFVPFLTVVWVLTIILDVVLLRTGYWKVVTRLLFIGLRIVNIIIAAAMLGVPSLLAISAASLTSGMGNAEAANLLMNMLNTFIRVALWLSIAGNGIEIIRAASQLVANDIHLQVSGKN